MAETTYINIIIAVLHNRLIKVRDVPPCERSNTRCKFEFRSQEWKNLSKTAIFIKVSNEYGHVEQPPVYVLLDDTNECNIPFEVIDEPGEFAIGLFGTNGDIKYHAEPILFKNKKGHFNGGSTPSEPTKNIYEQIIEKLEQKQDKLIAGDNISIVNNVISAVAISTARDLVVNANTHYDFPSIGDSNVIYKAEKERKIYQWDSTEMKYVPLCDIENEIELINGGDASVSA